MERLKEYKIKNEMRLKKIKNQIDILNYIYEKETFQISIKIFNWANGSSQYCLSVWSTIEKFEFMRPWWMNIWL